MDGSKDFWTAGLQAVLCLGLLREEVRPQGSENIPKYMMLKSSLSMATEGIGKGTGIRKRKPDKLDANKNK